MSIFYTTALHDKATIKTVSSTGSGAKENLLDNNLDTIWKPSGTSGQYITIDTNETDNQVDAFGFWIANHNTSYSAVNVTLAGSTDDSDYDNAYTGAIGSGAPLIIIDLSASVEDKRYWKIVFGSLGTAIELSHVFLFRKREFTRGPELPMATPAKFDNDVSGNFVTVKAQNHITRLKRKFRCVTDAEMTILHNVWLETGGARRIFAYSENSTEYLCRMDSKKGEEPIDQVDYQAYEYEFDYSTLKYVEDGETY